VYDYKLIDFAIIRGLRQVSDFWSNHQFENKKTALSGPLIFGLPFKIPESEKIQHQRSKILQPINQLSNSTQCIHAKELAKPILTTFNYKSQNLYHPNDSPKLNQITYELSNTVWNIQFQQKNKEKKQLLPYVKAIDKDKVIQKEYQALAAISHDLLQEYLVSQTHRNIKHMMVTFAILNNLDTINQPDKHYIVILFPDIEKYDILQIVLNPLQRDLHNLKLNGINDKFGNHWMVELYFSSDWKFLAICLGFNTANSKYFCPWCTCQKNRLWDLAIQECKNDNRFSQECQKLICAEMK
ncbi:8384_t:CDS:2, partial [Gigaspora margarita]